MYFVYFYHKIQNYCVQKIVDRCVRRKEGTPSLSVSFGWLVKLLIKPISQRYGCTNSMLG